jgi:hypothetical protein
VARGTKSYQILACVIAEAAPRLDVMDLKIFRSSAGLATPAVPLRDSTAELAISFWLEFQPRSFGSKSTQGFTWALARSCSRCGIGRLSSSRVSADRSASWLPVSKHKPKPYEQIRGAADLSNPNFSY